MSTALFFVVCAGSLLVGLVIGRSWLVLAAPALWVAGLAIAAGAGAFAPTSEDSS